MKRDKYFFGFIALQFINILLNVILGKYIAIYFDPSKFGDYSLINAVIALVSIMFITPSIQAFRKSYFNRGQTNFELLSFFGTLLILFSIVISLVSFIISFFLQGKVLFLICVLIFLVQSFYSLFSALINLEKRNILYTVLQLLIPTLTLSSLVLLRLLYRDSVLFHLFISSLFANITVLGFSFTFLDYRFKIQNFGSILTSNELRSLIKYIRPVLFLPIFSWIISSGDKFFINYFLNDHSVGLYSAAYSIGSKIFLSFSGVLLLWLNSSVFEEASNKNNIELVIKKTRKRILKYFLLGMIIVTIVQLFSTQIGRLLLSSQYADGFRLIGLLAFSQLILTSCQFWEQIFYASGNTRFILFNYIIGAFFNLILNLILIPKIGIIGSASSMILSSIIQYLYLHIIARKIILFHA